jgi:two-component system sensor histidine kinase EvgS
MDEQRLRQILLNLVGNAVKFTSAGRVVLRCSCACADDTRTTGQLVMEIEDTGIGIDENDFDIIFESFRQSGEVDARRHEGTGLGLAITKRLVSLMGGTIALTSQRSKGSIFTVTFPNVQLDVNDGLAKSYYEFDINRLNLNGKLVYLLSENESFQELIKQFLVESLAQIVDSSDEKEIRKALSRKAPDIFLVEGCARPDRLLHLLKYMKGRDALLNVPVLLITNRTQGQLPQQIIQSIRLLVKKPLSLSDLQEKLATVLATQTGKLTAKKKTTYAGEYTPLDAASYKRLCDEYAVACRSSSFVQLAQFAKSMISIGKNLKNPVLQKHGKELSHFVKNFDIDNINLTLKITPDLLKTLIKAKGNKLKQ